MKLFVLLLTAFIPSAAAVAQVADAKPTPQLYSEQTVRNMREIQRAAASSNYAYDQTRYMSYNIGPRLSGSPQAARAVEYVADQMRKLGLEVRLQKCLVPHWVRGEERGELVEFVGMAPGTVQKVVLTALGGSVATPPGGITAEVVVVESFEELAALGREKVEGKIVLFNFKFDTELQSSGFGGAAYGQAVQFRFGGAMAAARLGAVAALNRSAGGSQNRLAHTGSMGYTDGVPKIPGAAVSFEDAETIAHLAKAGKVKLHLTLTPQTLPDVESYNVIGDLKGTEKPDEVVIVSGHLDSWDLGQGAIDDASGVAVSMAVAKLLVDMKIRPKRTIRVIAWMNEENGGRGSAAYEKEESANIAKHFAAVEADLGASHPLGILFTGKPEIQAFLAPITQVLLPQGATQTQLQAGGVGADIGPLTRAGVPSFAPWFNQQSYFNYHHTAADTFDKIDPRQLRELGGVVAVLAYGLADLQQPLPR